MNRTIRNLIVAAPLATIALTLVPVGAATAGPNDGPNAIVIQPKGGDPEPAPKDIAIPKPTPKPEAPKDLAPKPAPKPEAPKDLAPKPQPQAPQPEASQDAPAAVQADVADTSAAPLDIEPIAEQTDGGLDLTWLLIGGGIVTASGIAFAARKRMSA